MVAVQKSQKWRVFSFIGKIKNRNPKINTTEQLLVMSEKFSRIFRSITAMWTIINNWDRLISNEPSNRNIPSALDKVNSKGLLEIHNKKWLALTIAINLYKSLISNPQRFNELSQGALQRISLLDSGLGKKISALRVNVGDEIKSIGPLLNISNNPQFLIAYINTHYDDLIKGLDSLNDKKLGETLRKELTILSNNELDELLKCLNDVRSWPFRSDRASYGINLFIERIGLFLNGGKSKFDGSGFLGFNMHFRDSELAKIIYKTPEIRRLAYYLKEIEFFRAAAYSIKKSVETEGNWEGFYEFYNNLASGKNYIKTVRDAFGNVEFANLLQEFKDKKHEAPIDWENELEKLEQELMNPIYADKAVVEAAAKKFSQIFEGRIKELREERVLAMARLQKILQGLGTDFNIRKEFLKILARRKLELRKELQMERTNFDSLLRDIILMMPEFEEKLQVLEISNTSKDILTERKVLEVALAWRKFIISNTYALRNDRDALSMDKDGKALTRMIAGTYKAIEAAEAERKLKQRIQKKHEASLASIQRLIDICENVLTPKMKKCILHISSKLQDYTAETRIFLNKEDTTFKNIDNFTTINSDDNLKQSGLGVL